MSRIGKTPIVIPPKVKVEVKDKTVIVTGPKGCLQYTLPERTKAVVDGQKVIVNRDGDDPTAKAMHGLSRALINNMVKGVSEGFTKRLEISGVGFKANVQSGQLVLNLGYSHPIAYQIPQNIKVAVEGTKIVVEGADKYLVGQVAARIRAFYPPEPYKGKGIKYEGEHIIRKEGKTVQ